MVRPPIRFTSLRVVDWRRGRHAIAREITTTLPASRSLARQQQKPKPTEESRKHTGAAATKKVAAFHGHGALRGWARQAPMGISSEEAADRRMEGWLYLVRHNRLGLQYSRKRYFVLRGNALDCFKTAPTSNGEVCLIASRRLCRWFLGLFLISRSVIARVFLLRS